MKIPMFPCKYHQNGGFSRAMLVLGRVLLFPFFGSPKRGGKMPPSLTIKTDPEACPYVARFNEAPVVFVLVFFGFLILTVV